ncbi:hypothetical protein Golob_025416 [Gossypium lobatum]|uniref:Uncharacterized protein n=1 Tax=Gossypium lobatum TaxID=34289 RepID=A0A7J8NJ70_9ROSI|nr:hypothetical protein [Gossypium lobatum]
MEEGPPVSMKIGVFFESGNRKAKKMGFYQFFGHREGQLPRCIYGLVIFPKALGYIEEAVSDLFDRLDRRAFVSLVPQSFREVDKVSYRVFSKNYSPLKELAATPRRDDITEERWIAILQNL